MTQRKGLGGFDIIDIMQTARSLMLGRKKEKTSKKPTEREAGWILGNIKMGIRSGTGDAPGSVYT